MAEGSALVLFSGGQDSTVCLAWALDRYARVETVGFAYGQRHAVELTQRPVIRNVGWDAREVKVVILSVPTKDLAPQTDHVDPS